MAKQLTLHNTKLKIHNAPPWICSCSFSPCIKVIIPLVSTCVLHLVHCFSLFFSPGMKREEVKWIELHHFPGVTQEMLVAHLLVLRLPASTPEEQWAGNFSAAEFLMETSSLQSARSWCCRGMVQLKVLSHEGRKTAKPQILKPRLGWKCWQGKRKNHWTWVHLICDPWAIPTALGYSVLDVKCSSVF